MAADRRSGDFPVRYDRRQKSELLPPCAPELIGDYWVYPDGHMRVKSLMATLRDRAAAERRVS